MAVSAMANQQTRALIEWIDRMVDGRLDDDILRDLVEEGSTERNSDERQMVLNFYIESVVYSTLDAVEKGVSQCHRSLVSDLLASALDEVNWRMVDDRLNEARTQLS